MNKLPKGLKRLSKDEFVNKSLLISEKDNFMSSHKERIGVEWNKLNKVFYEKKSIRW